MDDRDYLLNLTWAGTPRLSLPEVGQALVETAISLMQSTSDQKLTTVDVGTDRKYVVEMPQVTPGTAAAMLDLHQARALIDARDYRIEEFDASGVVLKQPFSVSFRLIRRSSQPSAEVPASEFDIPAGPDTIVIAGEADRDPVFAVMGTVLRELGRLRGR